MRRREELAIGEIYHVCNKSIADFKIFNNEKEFLRLKYMVKYFQIKSMPLKFSRFIELDEVGEKGFNKCFISISSRKEKLVEIIAYCIMPTHLHLVLKQLADKGISTFIGNILNSYSRYFNLKHKRKGPLWEGRFKNVLVNTDEQLLHLTRYIHLNPATAGLVDKPEEWLYSSYREYLGRVKEEEKICNYQDILDITAEDYKKFVEDRISYQRELGKIKNLALE